MAEQTNPASRIATESIQLALAQAKSVVTKLEEAVACSEDAAYASAKEFLSAAEFRLESVQGFISHAEEFLTKSAKAQEGTNT